MSDTQVTGTITDSNGLPYSFAMINAILVPGGPGPSLCNGSPLQPVAPFRADENGSFALMLCPNASITPAGSHWEFNVSINPGVPPPIGFGPQAFGVSVTIAGASQDLSSTLSAAAPVLARVSGGGGGSPGGANTDVQFNDGGVFGGDPNFTFDKTDKSFVVEGIGLGTGFASILFGSSLETGFTIDGSIPEVEIVCRETGGVIAIAADAEVQIVSQNGQTIIDGAAGPTGGVAIGTSVDGEQIVLGESTSLIGFFAATPVVKPTVTGSRGGNVALASLLTELATLGLITDGTSA